MTSFVKYKKWVIASVVSWIFEEPPKEFPEVFPACYQYTLFIALYPWHRTVKKVKVQQSTWYHWPLVQHDLWHGLGEWGYGEVGSWPHVESYRESVVADLNGRPLKSATGALCRKSCRTVILGFSHDNWGWAMMVRPAACCTLIAL